MTLPRRYLGLTWIPGPWGKRGLGVPESWVIRLEGAWVPDSHTLGEERAGDPESWTQRGEGC